MPMHRGARTLLAAALLVLVGACGGPSGPVQPAGSIRVTMTEFKFSPSTLSASSSSGRVAFYLVNQGNVAHDMVIVGPGGNLIKSQRVEAGGSANFVVEKLPPGTYQVYCDLPGHRESGMEATLQVT